MGVGSGLPICLAGIDIANQARHVKQPRNFCIRDTAVEESVDVALVDHSTILFSARECCTEGALKAELHIEMDTSQKALRLELAKEMESLDRRRQALRERRMRQADASQQFGRVRRLIHIRLQELRSSDSEELKPHGAKAA